MWSSVSASYSYLVSDHTGACISIFFFFFGIDDPDYTYGYTHFAYPFINCWLFRSYSLFVYYE